LLTCRYQKLPSRPSSGSSLEGSIGTLNNRDREESGRKEVLAQALALAAASSRTKPCLPAVCSLVELHDQQFQEMVDEFFKSYHNWIPIVHEESFRELYNKQLLHTSRGLTALRLSMCLLTRPFMNEKRQDALRISLYPVVKRLFWDQESMAQPTLPLAQSGVLLSFYEYGQGMIEAAYMTLCTCVGMAQICRLNETHVDQSSLPVPGFWTPQVEGERTWWAMSIHERFVNTHSKSSKLAQMTGYIPLQLKLSPE
jgi:hypothetical protein